MINHLITIALICAALSVAPVISAQTTSDLLEQGNYTEHTVGDLNEAIKIYEQIVSETEANRANAANALLRLGICYQKLGNTEKAEEYFDQLVDNYSDQAQVVAEAQSILDELNMAELDLLPAPWQDSARYHYEVLSPGGSQVGISEYRITKEFVDNNPQWNIQAFDATGGWNRYGEVEVSTENFKPIRSTSKDSSGGETEAIYKNDQIQLITVDSQTTSQQAGATYDGSQFLSLLQRLPLRLGYEENISVLYSGYGMFDITLKVKGIEEINVPAGTFESYRLQYQMVQLGKHLRTQDYWVSTGPERAVLRFNNNQDYEFQLAKINQYEQDNSPLYNNPDLGVSFSANGHWYTYDDSLDARAARVYLFAEEAGVRGEFTARLIPAHQLESHTAEQMRELQQNGSSRHLKDYVVRPESEIDLEIAGVPARSFIADYEHQGKKEVEYRTILRTENMGYWFTFRADPDVFEANKAQLDFITHSLIAP